LHLVRELIALRKATPALGGRADTEVVCPDYPFAYVRGGTHLVVVNPRKETASVKFAGAAGATALLARGVTIEGIRVTVDGFGFGVLALA
jgi:maltose alpha-D-glucosyltransferase/alpha-amylase